MIRAERRARLVEFERAEAVACEEALLARHLLRPLRARRRDNCRHDLDRPLRSRLRHNDRPRSKRRGEAVQGLPSARIRKTQGFRVLPANSRCSMRFPPPFARWRPRILRGFRTVSAWGACPACSRRCRPSSPACPATSAPRSCRACCATATPSAASPARRERVAAAGAPLDDLVLGDATTGAGLDRGAGRRRRRLLPDPLDGGRRRRGFVDRRAPPGRGTSRAPRPRAGVRRIVYLGGLLPADGALSRHLASRLAVEQALLDAAPESVALRASIVVGARSRSFRFLVRLIERLPVLALPAWRAQPHAADRRPRRARVPGRRRDPAGAPHAGRAVGHRRPGRDELRARCSSGSPTSMLIDRPASRSAFNLTPVASVVAAAVAGEDPG